MRPFEGSFSASGVSNVDLCLADCTINTYGFNLRQGQRGRARLTNNDRWFLIQLY
jgi:hypothetical protein